MCLWDSTQRHQWIWRQKSVSLKNWLQTDLAAKNSFCAKLEKLAQNGNLSSWDRVASDLWTLPIPPASVCPGGVPETHPPGGNSAATMAPLAGGCLRMSFCEKLAQNGNLSSWDQVVAHVQALPIPRASVGPGGGPRPAPGGNSVATPQQQH